MFIDYFGHARYVTPVVDNRNAQTCFATTTLPAQHIGRSAGSQQYRGVQAISVTTIHV
jgi:hypothetical protein